MPSYLNGIGRNHFQGYTADNIPNNGDEWKETQLNRKMGMYRGIKNTFSGGGKKLYRLGHNISDGNATYQICDFSNVPFPGWHWATDYKTGFSSDQWKIVQQIKEQNQDLQRDTTLNSLPGCCQITTSWDLGDYDTSQVTLGAGVHRFLYSRAQAQRDSIRPDSSVYRYFDKYCGFTININYVNSITIQSHRNSFSVDIPTNNSGYTIPTNFVWYPTAISSIGTPIIEQIFGPVRGETVCPGAYLVQFRITSGDDISYCGFVLSVNRIGSWHTMVRTQDDLYLTINPSTATGTAKERHSRKVTLNHCKIAYGSQAALYDPNIIYPYSNTKSDTLATAVQLHPVGYDNLEKYLSEADSLDADLSIVLNIGTGYPEEAVGLLEYLSERGYNVAFVELGSELMGTWNIGSSVFGSTPQTLGAATLRFAKRIKTDVPTTHVATTSTYNFSLDFNNNLGQTISQKIQAWLGALTQNGICYVDYVNIHNYPNDATAKLAFDTIKVKKLLAINEALDQMIYDSVYSGINKAGLSQQVGIVLTESNSADRSGTAHNRAQHITMTEAMYLAESFRAAAINHVRAFSPFALNKFVYTLGNYKLDSLTGDPSHPSSYFNDDADFNILFYPNNSGLPYEPNVYVKPAFKAKKMLAEGLGQQIIGHTSMNPVWDTVNIQYYGNVIYPNLGIMPTLQNGTDTVHLLVLNRSMSGVSTDFRLEIDGVHLIDGSIQTLYGTNIADKQPRTGITNTNNVFPQWEPIQANSSGNFTIPNFSINIIKAAIPPLICTTVNTDDKPIFTWNSVAYATGYYVMIGTTYGGSQVLIDTVGSDTSYQYLGLVPCTDYFITVIPFNAARQATGCFSYPFRTPCCINCQDLPITANATWPNVPNYTQGNSLNTVTVRAPATLTIPSNETLEFCPTGQLIIEPGAKVLLSGTLTSCGDSWRGVRVQDRLLAGATIPQRGQITASLGSQIRNAEVGISSFHGWVVCLKTKFLNNRIAFQSNAGTIPSNTTTGYFGGINRFTQCTFNIDADYTVPQPFIAHAVMNSAVNKMIFSNCLFKLNTNTPVIPPVNYGIQTTASSVAVSGTQTRFENLTYGLHTTANKQPLSSQTSIGALYVDHRVNITDATFDHCAVGIFDRTSTGNNWVRNKFYFGRLPAPYMTLFATNQANPQSDPNYGAQIGISAETNVYAFTLKDNQFYGQTAVLNITNPLAINPSANVQNSIGTNMVNIGSNETQVFRNQFYAMHHANLSIGKNADKYGVTGLRYECNDNFLNTQFDVLAMDLTDPITNQSLNLAILRKEQGRPDDDDPSIIFPVGNCFTDANNLPAGYQSHFRYTNPGGLNYWFDANIPCHEPTKNPLNLSPFPLFGQSNECADIPVLGEGESSPAQGLKWTPQQTNENRIAYLEAQNDLGNALAEVAPYYAAKVNELARLGYLSAIQEEQPFDSLVIWLQRMNTIESYLTLASTYAAQSRFDNALTTLQLVLSHFEDAPVADVEQMIQIYSALSSQESEMSGSTKQLLLDIASKTGTSASALARSILTTAGFADYAPILQLDASTEERSVKLEVLPKSHFLTAEPNPADQQVRIGVQTINTLAQKSIIIISDSNGKVVLTQVLAAGQRSFDWSTSGQATGIYFARLIVDDNHRDELKIVVQR
jgi:hypothetical protein